uniref:Uncharacterized protein n=1 Tax=Aegilops tauschii TaxID=37682 RepID=R7W4L4_AEGTA
MPTWGWRWCCCGRPLLSALASVFHAAGFPGANLISKPSSMSWTTARELGMGFIGGRPATQATTARKEMTPSTVNTGAKEPLDVVAGCACMMGLVVG